MKGTLSLQTLGRGVALERFDEEFQKVLENILDPNTEPLAKRKVIITVCVTPAIDRAMAVVDVSAQSRLAPSVSYSTRAYLGKDKHQQCLAFEDDPKQVTIDDFVAATEDKVKELKPVTEEVSGA